RGLRDPASIDDGTVLPKAERMRCHGLFRGSMVSLSGVLLLLAGCTAFHGRVGMTSPFASVRVNGAMTHGASVRVRGAAAHGEVAVVEHGDPRGPEVVDLSAEGAFEQGAAGEGAASVEGGATGEGELLASLDGS